MAIKLIDAAKAFPLTHQMSLPSLFFKISFSYASASKGVTSLQVFQLSLPPLCPLNEGLEPRIASIHVPWLSSLKKNKTCTRKEGQRKRGRKRGEYFLCSDERRYTKSFCCASAESLAVTNTSTHRQQQVTEKERIPHQCMTDIHLFHFLGQLDVENMQLATLTSEKPEWRGCAPQTDMQFASLRSINHSSQA